MNAPKTSITVEVLVNAPLPIAWHAYTNPVAITQWNFASDDWYCPTAENELRAGGKLKSRMEAKDGSFGFDFEAIYSEVIDQKKLAYSLGDGRQIVTTFKSEGDKTKVVTVFDAERENSPEMQQAGWQAILDNYKAYAERAVKMETLYFETEIKAPVSKVATVMLGEETYKEWTAEFNPTSRYKGSWQKGSKMLFIGTDKDGNEEGMVSRIKEHLPNKFVSIQHLGMVHKGQEITSGAAVEGWAGALENYSFFESATGTRLFVTLDSNPEFKDYFSEAWPRALKKLQQICEA
ncbi:MAG: SRPBCC domain-containing protein [Cytophagales bacterium]|nr:SRPBCC domain-containing protein [Cytophagales bacterium]